MKKLLFILSILASTYSFGQSSVNFAGKDNGATIAWNEIANESELKLQNNSGVIVGFTVRINNKGYDETSTSASSKISESQKKMLKNAFAMSKISFEDIKIKHENDTLLIPFYTLVKDGVNADLYRSKNINFQYNVNMLLRHPKIFAFTKINNEDSTKFTVISFEISSQQPDYYYHFRSKSNALSPDMIQFAQNARNNFYISNIKAVDNNSRDTISLNPIKIETENEALIRSKKEIQRMETVNFISENSNLKIEHFSIQKNEFYNSDTEGFIASDSNKFTKEQKEFIANQKIGSILTFAFLCTDKTDKTFICKVNVKLTK